ncbi:MAG: hypothetical protein JWO89_3678 [Verrucomicrobiaceae bacterium]|nr:hypothetical protein [Verrucomicrobiaceae bacterium]
MPDVGLFTATQPVDPEIKVIIKYSVEVGGLPVYQESYNVDTLAKDCEEDEAKAETLWLRRLHGPIQARKLPKFSSNLTEWLAEGRATHQSPDLDGDL